MDEQHACCQGNKKQFHLFLLYPVFLLIILALFFKFFGAIPLSMNSIVTNKTDLFTSQGEGKITAVPNIATITLGITITNNSISQAQTQINTTIKKITDDLKKLGVEEKDIKTTNYSVNPNYEYTQGKQKINGYQVSTNIEVKARDLEKINSIIDTATTDGANTVGNLQFEVEENKLKELQKEARVLAVKEAKEKAEGLAGAAGLKLGRIINVQENSTPIYRNTPMATKLDSSGGGGAPTEVQLGQQEIVINVVLTYETK